MTYKKVEKQLLHIDALASVCEMFVSGSKKNGGYGCKSKSKDKQMPGCCYAFDCPLAYEADIEDLKDFDPILYDQYKNDEYGIHDWVVQYRELIKKSTGKVRYDRK